MHIIIAGRGKMAQMLATVCDELKISHGQFGPDPQITKDAVAVHFGSGRQLEGLVGFCSTRHIPIIQGSTGQKLPDPVETLVVDAPNLALPIAYLTGLVPSIHKNLELMGMTGRSLVESHQATKTSVPGTAVKFSEGMGLSQNQITSVRHRKHQLLLGVPVEHLERHGYHWLTWQFADLEVEIVTRVHGLRPYALGTICLAEKILSEFEATDCAIPRRGVHSVIRIACPHLSFFL